MGSFYGLLNKVVGGLALLSLVAAFIVGLGASKVDHLPLLEAAFPTAEISVVDGSGDVPLYLVTDADGGEGNLVALATGSGFAGPLVTALTLSGEGEKTRIEQMQLLLHKDTPAYIEQLNKARFFKEFSGKSISADFIYNKDIDGVSGATITARGITDAVRQSAHATATQHLLLEANWRAEEWSFGVADGLLATLIVLVVYSSFVRNRVAEKIAVLVPYLSLAFIGFYLNAALSIGSLGAVVMGYFPDPVPNPAWWLITGSVLTAIFLFGRNIYCHKLCPFHAVQILLNKIGGFRFTVAPLYASYARRIVLFLVWASLMLIFLSRHPSAGSYEPFSMMFSLNGLGVQWYILPLCLFGSLFIPSFWCRLFCPVGHSLNALVGWRMRISMWLRSFGKEATRTKAGPAAPIGGPRKRKAKSGSAFFTGVALLLTLAIFAYFTQSFEAMVDADILAKALQ